MSTILDTPPVVTNAKAVKQARVHHWQIQWRWEHAALGAILALAAFLGLWNLSINGYSNAYYAAAVRSMTESWKNFFFVSFDPGGFVTVDKPPVAFWVQAAFAKVLGFSGVSLLLPEALAGVGSVFLLYLTVKRAFGTAAGLISALILAVTPIFVVMNRDNNPDSILVFVLILAAWALLKATEKGQLRWLMLAGVLVGVGFNVKMLAAYIVLPAFYLTYFLFARTTWRKRILHLTLVTFVIAAISFSWAVAVDLTPASQRPYVGGSSTNSELDLIINYNGLGRVDGNEMPGGNAQPSGGFAGNGNNGGMFGTGQPGLTRLLVPTLAGEFNWFGPLALLGLVYLMANAWFSKVQNEARFRRLQMVTLWGGWLLTYAVVFSFSKGVFHNYYLNVLAPAIAALAGSAIVVLWQQYRRGSWQGWLLPLGLAATAGYQVYILSGYTSWNQWLGAVLAVVAVVAVVGLGLGWWLRKERFGNSLALGVTGVTLAALLITPLSWSIRAVFSPLTGAMPSGTPNGSGGGGFNTRQTSTLQSWFSFVSSHMSGQLIIIAVAAIAGVGLLLGLRFVLRQRKFFTRPLVAAVLLLAFTLSSMGWWVSTAQATTATVSANNSPANFGGGQPGEVQANQQLIQYLEANQGDYQYLVAVSNAGSAEGLIIATGKPVMALGGFSGSDKIITSTAQLEALIANHTVRYFMIGGGNGGGRGGGTSIVSQYIQQNCQVVSYSATSTTSGSNTTTTNNASGTSDGTRTDGGFGGQTQQLYRCGS